MNLPAPGTLTRGMRRPLPRRAPSRGAPRDPPRRARIARIAVRTVCALAALLASVVGPTGGPFAPVAAAEPPDERPVVVGTGDRVSGRIDVLWIGPADAPLAAAFRRVAEAAAHRGLRVEVTHRDSLRAGDVPSAPLVAAAWPCAPETADGLVAFARDRPGLLVLVGDVASARASFPAMEETSLTVAGRRVATRPLRPGVDAADATPSPAAPLPRSVALAPRHWPAATVLLIADAAERASPPAAPGDTTLAEAMSADDLALAALRHAITRAGGVRHVPSAFVSIRARVDGGRVVIEAPTSLEGSVTTDVVALDGTPLVAPRPLGAFDASALPDPQDAVLRLTFRGSGVEEVRPVRLADTVEARVESCEVTGPGTVLVGDRAAFRVTATRSNGAPAPGCSVRGTLGDDAAEATTDSAGVALLSFAPRTAATSAPVPLVVATHDVWAESVVRTTVRVDAYPPHAVEIDRPLHRPGDLVRGLARTLAADGRPAPAGRAVVRVLDARKRLVRSFDLVTEDSGAAAFEFALAPEASCGRWTVEAAAPPAADADASRDVPQHPTARAMFDVADTHEEPFEVRIELDPSAASDLRARGAVVVREWDGRVIEDAVVTLSVAGMPEIAVPAPSPAAFDVELPASAETRGEPTIRAVVRHRGETATATATLPRPGMQVLVAADVHTGDRLAVTVRADGAADGVIADLVLSCGPRLLATAAAIVRDGRATAELAVPSDARGGPCVVTAALRGAIPVALAATTVSALRVGVSGPAETAPGEETSIRIRVADADGRPAPATLSVLGADAAWAAAAAAGDGPSAAPDAVRQLGRTDGIDEGEDRFLLRAAQQAASVLEHAATAANRGEAVAGVAPWGTRVLVAPDSGAACVAVELPATGSFGLAPGTASRRAVRSVAAGVSAPPGPDLASSGGLLPVEPLPSRGDRFARLPDSWLQRHQSPDGGWDPHGLAANCRPAGVCDDPGPPGMRISATSLALLDFLGAGETHQSGNAKDVIRAGLHWLLARQAEDGFVGARDSPCAVLEHAFATLALTEAWGMTQSGWLRAPARSAVAALVRLQREDGGFSEAGSKRGSVVAATIAMMAVKSARMADIPDIDLPREVTERHLAWMRDAADSLLGAPLPDGDEASRYPFGRTHRRRLGAASAALLRTFAGESAQSAEVLRLTGIACEDPPHVSGAGGEPEDPFSLWIGSLAVFQGGGSRWSRADRTLWTAWSRRMETAVLESQCLDASCSGGSWRDPSGAMGRFFATTFSIFDLSIFYRYGRVFGVRGDGADAPRVRSWFPDTCVSELGTRTDAAGRRDVPFVVPDRITTWRFDVGARDRDGRFGRGRAEVRATLPLVVTAALPPRLAHGDVVHVPVSARSALAEDADCAIGLVRSEGCDVVTSSATTLHVPAGGVATTSVTLRVTSAERVVLGLRTSGGGAADAVEVASEAGDIVPPPVAVVRVAPGATVRVASVAADARAKLRVFRSPLGASRSAVEALIRRPTGCFEQTCATLWPAALAARMVALPGDDPRLALLRDGVQRVLAFEVGTGGFSLFRADDATARADLTALGIHVLLDLAEVSPPDAEVLRRAGEFLDLMLPSRGAESVFALGALRRLGRTDLPPPPPLDDDPYLLGLALTQDLLAGDAARDAVRRLESLADTSVRGRAIWRSKSIGLFSGVTAGIAETTAVAVEALARAGGDAKLVREGLVTVRETMTGDGAWRTTRETVAALRALLASRQLDATGRIVAEIPGRPSVVFPLDAEVLDVDLGAWTADAALTLRHEGAGEPWAMLIVRGGRIAGGPTPEPALVTDVTWPADPVRVGDVVQVRVTLRAAVDAAVEAPMVVVPLPGGFSVEPGRLLRAALSAGFHHAEFAGGEVRLYASRLAHGAALGVDLPCVARTAGTFRAAAATSYPYYEPDRVTATGVAVVEIAVR